MPKVIDEPVEMEMDSPTPYTGFGGSVVDSVVDIDDSTMRTMKRGNNSGPFDSFYAGVARGFGTDKQDQSFREYNNLVKNLHQSPGDMVGGDPMGEFVGYPEWQDPANLPSFQTFLHTPNEKLPPSLRDKQTRFKEGVDLENKYQTDYQISKGDWSNGLFYNAGSSAATMGRGAADAVPWLVMGGGPLGSEAGVAGAAGLRALGASGKIAQFGGGIAGSLPGTLAFSSAESRQEGFGAYQEAIALGMSDSQALEIAEKVESRNYMVNPITNSLEFVTTFGPLVIPGKGFFGKLIKGAAGVGFNAATGAAEEGIQEVIKRQVLDQPVELDDEMIESLVSGGALGGGFHVAGKTLNSGIRSVIDQPVDMDISGENNGAINYMVDMDSPDIGTSLPGKHFDIKDGVNWDGIQAPERAGIQRLIFEYNQAFPDDRLTVTDGLRDQNANYGSPTSFHKAGKGVDLWSGGILNDPSKREWLVNRARELGFGEVLDEVSSPSARATGAHFHIADFQGDLTNLPASNWSRQNNEPGYHEQQTYDFTKDDLPDFGELKNLTPERVHELVAEDTRNFSAQLDKWDRGELGKRDTVKMGLTPEVITLLGAKQLPMEISPKVLNKIVYEKHGISLDSLKQLPAQIADPWYVFKSKTKDNSLVVYTTLKDQNNKEVMAAIHMDVSQSGRHRVNAIASVYGRNNTHSFIQQNIKDNNALYVNTKKNQEMQRSNPATIAGGDAPFGSSSNILTEKDLTFNKENLAGQNPQNVNFNKSYMPGGIYDGMNYNESQTDGKTVSRRDIMDRITNFMGIPIRYGRLGPIGRKAKGWHDSGRGLIRVGERFDWDTITHEIGHHVDQKLGGVSSDPKHHAELSKWVSDLFGDSYAQEDLASEGVAEFFRQYLTNHEKAKENFPSFYKEMDARLKRNPKVLAELRAIKEDFDTWRNQASEDRVAGSISFDEKSKIPKSLSDVANAAIEFGQKSYDGWVEQFEPLNRLEKEIEKITGKKLPEHLKIFEKARLYRGWAGKFATTISDGINGKGTSLKSVMQLVKGKEKEFSSYLVALREENASYIEANDPEVKYSYTLSSQDRKATLTKYNSSETFQKARELLRKYNNEQLDMLAEAGMKKQEDVDYLKSKWPDYVPLYRDFSSEAEVDSFIGAGKNLVNIGDPISHKFKGSQRDIINPIESIVKNTFVFTQRAEANKVGRTLLDLSQMQGMGHLIEEVPGSTDAKEGVISVWVSGEKKMFQVAPDIYNALMGLQAESSGFVSKIIAKGEMVVRLSSTILEPAFAITNTMRDTVTAFINAEHGFIPIVDNINGFMSFWRKDNHYTEWMNSGGANSQMVALDRNEIKKALNELRSDAFWENLNWEKAKYYLTYISEASEVSTRLGVYKKARGKGASIHKAALESRDVTLDFARSGKTARSMKIAFFGAWIQGLDKISRSFKEHPGRTSARVAQILVAPSAILFLAQHDDERWKELQRRDKDRFWYIIPSALAGNKMTKDQFDALLASGKTADQILKELEESGDMIKIPKPQSIGLVFASGTERTLDWMKNDNPKAFTDYASSLWSDLSPNIMPMIAKIPLEWGSNYSFFRDRDIVGQGVKDRPNWLQYDRNTSELSKKAGELTKGLGPLEISPMQLDNAVRNMGSLFGTGLQVSDLALGADNKKPTAKLPEYYGAKRVMQGSFSSPQSVSDFYTDFRTQSKFEEEFEITGERPESFDPGYLKQLKVVEKQLKLLNKHEAGFRDSPTLTADQKRKEIDKIQLKKLELARKVVK